MESTHFAADYGHQEQFVMFVRMRLVRESNFVYCASIFVSIEHADCTEFDITGVLSGNSIQSSVMTEASIVKRHCIHQAWRVVIFSQSCRVV